MKKLKKSFLFVLLLLSVQFYGLAQSNFKNGVFLEVGGLAYVGSINYERQFNHGLTGRVGITYYSSILVIPVAFGKVFGEKKHHFEIASGITYARNTNVPDNSTSKADHTIAITAFVGYRYQAPEKRFFFKAGFTPIWSIYYSPNDNAGPSQFFPWWGVSGGFRF